MALGVYITGKGKENIADIVLYLAEIVMTIPSLALFGLLMVILSSIGLTTIGFLPAIIALTIYAQLTILRNTYVGINSINPAIVEAARGMGMTRGQIARRIELPLALPVIMTGIRISTVVIVGTATLATLIAAGGLGRIILAGVFSSIPLITLQGAAPTAALAITLGAILELIERWMTPWGLKVKA